MLLCVRLLLKDQEPTEEVALDVMIWSRCSINTRPCFIRFFSMDIEGEKWSFVLVVLSPNYPKLYSMYSWKQWFMNTGFPYLVCIFVLLWFAFFLWQARHVARQTANCITLRVLKSLRCFLTLMKTRCTLSESNAKRPQCSRTWDFRSMCTLMKPRAVWQAQCMW